jgi:hypothetical protein
MSSRPSIRHGQLHSGLFSMWPSASSNSAVCSARGRASGECTSPLPSPAAHASSTRTAAYVPTSPVWVDGKKGWLRWNRLCHTGGAVHRLLQSAPPSHVVARIVAEADFYQEKWFNKQVASTDASDGSGSDRPSVGEFLSVHRLAAAILPPLWRWTTILRRMSFSAGKGPAIAVWETSVLGLGDGSAGTLPVAHPTAAS